MQLGDQKLDLSEPEQAAVGNNVVPINDSSAEKDCEKAYSTRKRISAPRRYSPTPSWERWESWRYCAAVSAEKSESANILKAIDHINGKKDKISFPRTSSRAISSYDDEETNKSGTSNATLLPKKKIRKRSRSRAPSDPEKTRDEVLLPATDDQRNRSFGTAYSKKETDRRDSPATTNNRYPTPAATNLKKTKNRPPSLRPTDPEKNKCRPPTPPATAPKKTKYKPPIPAATAVEKTKYTSCTYAATGPKKLVRGKARQNKKSELKEKPKAGWKRKRNPKKPLDVKQKKSGTKRSAPKRYSPTYLSDRKMTLFAGEVKIASITRGTTPTADISESISVKWANVLNRNSYVLLERYVPPSSYLPLDNTKENWAEDEFGSEGSGSRVCTPTPSWMDEEEMASYYNSEIHLDLGRRSPAASSDNGSLASDKDVLDYDRSTCSPLLNDVAITTSIIRDQEKSSPILSLNNTAIDTGPALEDEFDTCSPIPPLDVSSIFTALEDEIDVGKCIPKPLWGDTDEDGFCTSKLASNKVLCDTAATTVLKSELEKAISIDGNAADATDRNGSVKSCLPSAYVKRANISRVRSVSPCDKTATTENKLFSTDLPLKEAVAGATINTCSPLVEASVVTSLRPVTSHDETAIDTSEKKAITQVSEDSVGSTEHVLSSAPSLAKPADRLTKTNKLAPVMYASEASGGTIEEKKSSPVPSLGGTSVGTIDKTTLSSASLVNAVVLATTEDRSGQIVAPSVGGREKRSSPVPSQDGSAVDKTTLSPPSFVDEASFVTTEDRSDEVRVASVGTSEEKRSSPVPPQDRTSVGKKTSSPASSEGEASFVTTEDRSDQVDAASVGPCENKSSSVLSLDRTPVGTTDKKALSSASSVDDVVLATTEDRSDQVGAASVSTTEKRECDRVSQVDEGFGDISENVGSCRVDSLDRSVMPNCVASVSCDAEVATTEEILLCTVSSSDDTVLSKTDTYKPVTSRCVQTVGMVDASVDTTELFPFPPLNNGTSTVDKTEKNGSMTRECISSLPLCDTAVDTSELDTKVPICNLSSGESNPIPTEKDTLTRPVTRQQRLNAERISCASTAKPTVNNLDSVKYNPFVNKSTFAPRSYCVNVPPKPVKTEMQGLKRESLILIRRDYTTPQSSYSPLCFSSVDINSHRSWEDDSRAERHSSLTRTNEENVTMNPDLTEEDVFDILFGQSKRRDAKVRKDARESHEVDQSHKRKHSDVDSESRCPSPLSGSPTTSAGDFTPDVFEIVSAKKRYSPTVFRHDSRNLSPIPVNAVLPRPRKRSYYPAVSVPEESSSSEASSTLTSKRRSLSNNLDEKPGESTSGLSLNVCRGKGHNPTSSCLDETTNSSTESSFYFEEEKKPYATRSARSAPKRYSPTSFFDAYYYYDHKDQYTKKSLSDSGNKSDNGSNRKVRQMSVKSSSRESLKVDDDEHWGSFHGASCTKQCASLTIIRDTPVPRDIDDTFRAQKTAPPEVSVADSKIPDAGNGAWASEAIPAGTRFGPYEGRVVPAKVFTSYAWLIRKNGKPDRCVDATEPGLSNWMRFVNCARHDGEQNLEAFQCHGNIYYKTTRQVNPHEELLVWYGDEYGRQLGIDPEVCDEDDEKSWREKNFKCPGCPFAFASPLYLQSHKRVCRDLKSGARATTESKPKETSKSNKKSSLVKIRKANSQSDLLKKDRPCAKSFAGPMQLGPSGQTWKKSHEQRKEVGYFCKLCNIRFLRKYHWERHLITKRHGAKEPYSCSQCNKTFHVKSSLTRHMKIHTGEKPHACPMCNHRFSDKGNLKKHMENHIGKKYFACSECKMKFTEKGSLTKHYYSKHTKTDKKIACSVCKKRYCDKKSLRRHQMIHNGEKPFACFVCNKRFSRREVLKTHLQVHSIGYS